MPARSGASSRRSTKAASFSTREAGLSCFARARVPPRSATGVESAKIGARGGRSETHGRPPGGAFVNIPNSLTLGRIVLVPLIVWLIIAHEMTAAFLLFLLAGFSDAADGFLA